MVLLKVFLFSNLLVFSYADKTEYISKESYESLMADIEFTSKFDQDEKRSYRYTMQPNTSITVEGVVAENSMMFPLYNKRAHTINGLRNRYGCDPIEEKGLHTIFLFETKP